MCSCIFIYINATCFNILQLTVEAFAGTRILVLLHSNRNDFVIKRSDIQTCLSVQTPRNHFTFDTFCNTTAQNARCVLRSNIINSLSLIVDSCNRCVKLYPVMCAFIVYEIWRKFKPKVILVPYKPEFFLRARKCICVLLTDEFSDRTEGPCVTGGVALQVRRAHL